MEVFVAAYVKFEDLTQRLYLLDLFFFTFPSLLLCLERKSVLFEILYLYLEFFLLVLKKLTFFEEFAFAVL